MPRTYKPKNKYCRNTKFSEEEFVDAFGAFMAGLGAAAHARNASKTERSVRALFARFRDRLSTDQDMMGWLGVSDALPDSDDEVWPLLHECMFDCKAYVDDRVYRSPTYSSEYRGTDWTCRAFVPPQVLV